MLLSTREAYMKVKAIADCDSSFLVLGNFSSAPITRQMQAKREPIVLTLFEQMFVSKPIEFFTGMHFNGSLRRQRASTLWSTLTM